MPSAKQIDPTQTGKLRKEFQLDMRRRMLNLKKAIYALIVEEDAFGLSVEPFNPAVMLSNQRFRFESDPQKIAAYQSWLQEQFNAGLLEKHNNGEPWTDMYAESAYRKGINDAYIAARPELAAADVTFAASKAQFLADAFSSPVNLKQLGLLKTRQFETLKGITNDMSAKMSNVLADGFSRGHNPRKIARELANTVDGITRKRALTLARTEIVRSYNEAQLDSFEMLGVDEVGVLAEWATAGDDLVCPLCLPLEATVWTVKEARAILPRHPNCRCAWIPFVSGVTKGSKTSSRSKSAAISKSVRAERPKAKNAKEARKESRWVGAARKPKNINPKTGKVTRTRKRSSSKS
jgi:SPP1 gp7 family putative phage head morphogenesis protein